MQHSGTLRKRQGRHITKVKCLSQTTFDLDSGPIYSRNRQFHETRISISSPRENARSRRVTRDPTFHSNGNGNFDFYEDERSNNVKARNDQAVFNIGDEECYDGDRQHFFDKTVLRRLYQIIWLGIFSCSFPWKWNSSKFQIENWGSKLDKVWDVVNFLLTCQTMFLTGYLIYNFMLQLEHQEEGMSYRVLFMKSLSVIGYSNCVLFDINIILYKDKIREYINTLLNFNHNFVRKYVIHLNDYEDNGRFIIKVIMIMNMSQIPVRMALFLAAPNQSSYLISYILPQPWYWLIPGTIHQFVFMTRLMVKYILYEWLIVAHSTSIDFWLRESHKRNESGFTKENLRHQKTAEKTYRSLQVLCTCFNESIAPMCVPLLKYHIFTAALPCGFVSIRSLNNKFIKEFPGILSYPMCVCNVIAAGFCLMKLAAQLHDLSCGFVDSWCETNDKDTRRFLMSCAALKVRVGRFYFVTVSTTITFIKTVVDYIINCIMTFP